MDNEEESRSLASLLNRTYLDEETSILTYINLLVGNYDKETGIFHDDQGREYPTIDSEEASYGQNPYIAGNIINIDKAYEQYTDSKTADIQDLLDSYDMEESKFFYLTSVNEQGKYVILKLNHDEIVKSYNEKKNSVDVDAEAKEIDFNNQIDEQEILNSIKNNEYTKEELIELKRNLTSLKKRIRKIIDVSEKKIKEDDSVTHNEEKKESRFYYADGIIKPSEVLKEIKKKVIAQDEAAAKLVIEYAKRNLDQFNKENINMKGILLVGNTGVGKTLLAEELARLLDRPFLSIDTNQITTQGYVGESLEQVLWKLYVKCNKDKEKTESAIVFFDEIDKKGSKNKDDVGGQGVLNMLLKFLDGTKYNATPSQSGLAERVEIDTSKMIVIAGGAFTDVYDREFEHGIGFGHEVKKPYKPSLEDFVDKGMMTREFMGRFPSIIRLRDLNKEDMLNIMDNSSVSPIKLEKERYKAVGVKLNINDDVKDYAASKAVKSKAGARALTGIISEITNKSFGDALNNRGKYKDMTITKETIEDPSNYLYTLKDNQKIKQKKAFY
ncbi:MAG: AAA family ATPase [Bacilli bacterium]|nr:AAA family ATPase [Bacilli bacterium]